MEILSTGEKIKRARVYKGVTLKELCGDKISISKMSCIENEKVEADDEILLYISERLKIEYEYLKEGVKDQILQNIKMIENKSIIKEDLDSFIKMNLNYAKENRYTDLAFKLIHMLFERVIENGIKEELQEIITQYFDMYEADNSIENILIYYNDMAEFYSLNNEYNEAINYYNKALIAIEKYMPKDKEQYLATLLKKGVGYLRLNDVKSSFLIIDKVKKNVKKIKDEELIGKILHIYANLCILLQKEDVNENLELAFKYLNKNDEALAQAYAETAKSYFVVNRMEEARKYLEKSIDLYKKIGGIKYVRFLINCIEGLFQYNQYNFAMNMIEEALNLAICTNDIRLIERAYYFKGMMLQISGDFVGAEMYMNLSTDSLLKFAAKSEKFKRYNEMGQLYYNLNEFKESIKYFTLAMGIEKEL